MATNAEQLLISAILRKGSLDTAYKCGISSKMFHTYKEQFDWIEKYYLNRSRVPEKAAFAAKFSKGPEPFRIKEADDVEHYTFEVRKQHTKRSITQALNSVLEDLDADDPETALNSMFSSSMKISSDLGLVNDGDILVDHEDILQEFAIRRERFEKYGASGIPTGFPTFDERTGGFAPGELWIPAARPGMGKSYLLQKIALTAAIQGYKCVYNALEQPRANVLARLLPMYSNRQKLGKELLDSRALIQGRGYNPEDLMELLDDMRANIRGNLHVTDGTKGRISPAKVAAQIERHKPDVVFIDHISLMERNSQDHAGLAEVADELTHLANQYQIPVIAASQLNRQGSQRGAGLETLAESDKIGQNASGVIMIDRPCKRVVKYHVEKYRNGESDFGWWAEFNPMAGVYREITYDRAQEIIQEEIEKENDK